MPIPEVLKVGDFFFYLIPPLATLSTLGNLAAHGSPHRIGWDFKE